MKAIPPDGRTGSSRSAPPGAVDVVVIGAGIVGASAALCLAERGVSVALCEKGEPGAEQSGRNWGWVRQIGRDVAEVPLAGVSLAAWRGLNARTGAETGFRETGNAYLCRTQAELDRHARWMAQVDVDVTGAVLMDRSGVADIVGSAAARSFVGGLHSPAGGRAEPALATPAIVAAARARGACVLERCAVRGLETEAGRVSAVVTELGTIRCASVVLAAGAWTRLFAGNLGIDFPQARIIGSVARVGGVPPIASMPIGGSDWAFRARLDGGYTIALRNANIAPITPDSLRLARDFAPALMRQRAELRLRPSAELLHGWRAPRRWPLDGCSPFERMRTLDPAPNERFNRRGLASLARLFPAFASARVEQSWAGVIDVTPDAVPVISPVASRPGLYIASGFSGHGFGIGPGAGQLVAELVTNATPCVDPTPFRAERFARLRNGASGTMEANASPTPQRRSRAGLVEEDAR